MPVSRCTTSSLPHFEQAKRLTLFAICSLLPQTGQAKAIEGFAIIWDSPCRDRKEIETGGAIPISRNYLTISLSVGLHLQTVFSFGWVALGGGEHA